VESFFIISVKETSGSPGDTIVGLAAVVELAPRRRRVWQLVLILKGAD